MIKSASATATGLSPFYCLKKFFEVVLAFLLQKVHLLLLRVYLLFTALKSLERKFYLFYYKILISQCVTISKFLYKYTTSPTDNIQKMIEEIERKIILKIIVILYIILPIYFIIKDNNIYTQIIILGFIIVYLSQTIEVTK